MTHPTIHELDTYKVPEMLIPRIMKEHGYTKEFSTKAVREVKRMLYIHTVLEPASPSNLIDMAWHEMLLFTRFYKDFCTFLDTDFIHHDPTPGPPDNGRMYLKTKENYKIIFGIEPDI